jgi:hypothetical protein
MRYTDKEGNPLNLNECMTADSFLMEADVLYPWQAIPHQNSSSVMSSRGQ